MKLPSDPKHRRLRPFVALLVLAMVIGLAWIVEINSFLSHVRKYTGLCLNCPSSGTKIVAVPTKKCVRLNHRDPKFITKKNKKDCFSKEEVVAILRDLVFVAARTFEAHNLTYFLESGTLLGSYREKGVIRRDKDADLGVDAATLEYVQKNKVKVPDEYFLAVWNSTLYPNSGRDNKLPMRFIHKETAMYSDVFAFLDWKNETAGTDEVGPLPSVCFGSCAKCPDTKEGRHFKIPREWVYPVIDCPFEGHTLKCPRETVKYLKHLYGKNFMKPN